MWPDLSTDAGVSSILNQQLNNVCMTLCGSIEHSSAAMLWGKWVAQILSLAREASPPRHTMCLYNGQCHNVMTNFSNLVNHAHNFAPIYISVKATCNDGSN